MWKINYFHVQILMFELLFVWRLEKRRQFWLRFIPLGAAYIALPFVTPFKPFFFALFGWFSPWFLIMIGLSGLLLFCCFRLSGRQVIFYCCVAHTLQHMVHCLSQVAARTLHLNRDLGQGIQLSLMALFAAGAYFLLRKRFGGRETVDIKRGHLTVFAVATSLVVYFLSYWATSRETATTGLYLFDIIACALLLVILLDMFRFREAEREQLIMMRILRQEREQHELSKATVDVINRKCHDLKHQISALRNMPSEERERSIGELERAILIYDSFAKTGNEDLDIVLAEKTLLCEEKGVKLQCIADGAKLRFMKTEDLYSLLGNALDNAIEAAVQEETPARRVITLRVSAREDIVTIHIENPCRQQPLMVDGLPVTTKRNRDYHGFGVKSMRYVAQKYDGALTVDWEDGMFYLDILFSPERGAAA